MSSLKRYGTAYGGYMYPAELGLGPDAVIYSAGAGEDISHDVQLAAATGATVHIFDPTPRAIEHVKYVQGVLGGTEEARPSRRYGGGDPAYWRYIYPTKVRPEQLVLHPYGVFTESKTVDFYMPENPEWVSCSMKAQGRPREVLSVPVKSLADIAAELGHPAGPDLLKLDIECVECEVLQQMVQETVFRPRYIAVDFDSARTGNEGARRVMKVIGELEGAGYRLLQESGWDASFVYEGPKKT